MKIKFDYIRALFGGRSDQAFSYPANTRRILRKLAREAAMEMVGSFKNHEKNAQKIAKRLVP